MMFKRIPLAMILCAVLFVTSGFAASKKFDRHNRSSYRNDSSARNEDLTSAGRSVPSRGMAASLSNGERSGSSLILASPGTPDRWEGGTGNWSAAGNWNHGVPGMNSDVTIHSGGLDNVTLDISSTINTLKLGGMTGSSSLVGDPTPQNLTVLGALTIGLNGNLCACASGGFGTIAAGSLVNRGSIVFETSGDLQISGNAKNSGFLQTGFETGSHVVNIAGKLTNSGQFLLDGHGDAATLGRMVNSGSVDVSSASTLTVNGRVNNTGTITTGGFSPGGNTIVIAGKLINSGTFQLNGGDGFVGNGMSNSGAVNLETGSSLSIAGDFTNTGTTATEFNGMGSGGNTVNISGNLSNSGTIELLGVDNALNVTGTLTNEASGQFLLTGLTFHQPVTATLGGLVNAGFVEVGPGGGILQVNGDASNSGQIIDTGFMSTLNVTGTLTNSGDFELQGGPPAMATIGSLVNSGTFQLNGPGDMATIGNGVTNSGTIDLENISTLNIAGDVNNTGNFYTSNLGGSGGNTVAITGMLTNSGTFQLNGPGDMATLGSLTSSGTVGVNNNSTLALTGNLANSGSLDLENMSQLQVSGDANNSGSMTADFVAHGNGSNTITINGTLTNSGLFGLYGDSNRGFNSDYGTLGNLINTGTVNVGGTSQLTVNGDVNNSGTISTAGLVVNTGFDIIRISGNLTNQAGGQFILYGGIFGEDLATIGGGLTNAGLVDVENLSTLQVGGDVTNSGTLETNAFGNGGGNAITITGMLTNAPTGQITLNGPGDVLVALAGLTNNGSISLNNGSTIDPPFVNNIGTMNIGSLSKFVVGTGNPGGTGYIQLANGTLGEMISSTNFGVINVNGSALLDGTLAVLLQGGYNPAVGSMYKFLLANPGQINGTFASILNDIFNGGTEKWLVTYDNADGFVELTAEANNVPEPATLLVLIPGLLGMAYGLRRRSVR